MLSSDRNSLAEKYLVDDLPGARQMGSRLYGILAKFDAGAPVSEASRAYLLANKLHCLHALLEGRTGFDAFSREAAIERAHRMKMAEIAASEAADEEARRKAERVAASAEIFADPQYKRRQEVKQLKRRFNLGYIEPERYPRTIRLLQSLANDERLQPKDVTWLQVGDEDCWTNEVATAWHLVEAKVLTAVWRETKDPWDAINASSHWRKAGNPEVAISLTEEALAATEKSAPKVRSALATTRGAAFRAVDRLAEAKALGEEAHALAPNDYRPCTLLGAVHMELNEIIAGHEWFMKAEERGAAEAAVDHDIKALLARMPEAERDRIRAFLLDQDPERFAWLRSKRGPSHKIAQVR
ncbi:hypothetical protein K3179_02380 [Qipengyuania sp. GH38]|uniref:hypothetical protein n=1 Tax=Qipengyuania intermedia TaxID=2867244 RepID=UPI001C8759D3|nr:hypothetical protein [Qipengyuania intermedia]MBX7513389.1 hypothetical protein [Qipengyuania intermedia]